MRMKYCGHISHVSPDVLDDPIWKSASFLEYSRRLGGMPKFIRKKKFRNHIGRAISKKSRERKRKYSFKQTIELVERATNREMTTAHRIIDGKKELIQMPDGRCPVVIM